MTRTSHKAHPTPGYPVYCLDWADDETLLMGGGGGASRSGIDNKLKMAKVSKDGRKIQYIHELKLSNEEDAPMTIAVDRASKHLITGINASSSSIQSGSNAQCRTFSYADNQIKFAKGQQTIQEEWSDDYPYQKLTALSPGGDLVAVGTTDNKVAILRYPSLETAFNTISLDAELVDLDFGGLDGEWLVAATVSAMYLYRFRTGEKSVLDLKQTIYPPSLDIVKAEFRASRFSRNPLTPSNIHAVLNASKSAKRGAPRKSWVVTFGLVAGPSNAQVTSAEKEGKGKGKEVVGEGSELGRWDVVVRREVAGKPVTVFDVSSNGQLLAYGCSDLSIGILDSKTLAPQLKILAAHSFPPTALKFNPSASLLVSASADNTIRAIVIPASFAGASTTLILIILTILILLLALFMRR